MRNSTLMTFFFIPPSHVRTYGNELPVHREIVLLSTQQSVSHTKAKVVWEIFFHRLSSCVAVHVDLFRRKPGRDPPHLFSRTHFGSPQIRILRTETRFEGGLISPWPPSRTKIGLKTTFKQLFCHDSHSCKCVMVDNKRIVRPRNEKQKVSTRECLKCVWFLSKNVCAVTFLRGRCFYFGHFCFEDL